MMKVRLVPSVFLLLLFTTTTTTKTKAFVITTSSSSVVRSTKGTRTGTVSSWKTLSTTTSTPPPKLWKVSSLLQLSNSNADEGSTNNNDNVDKSSSSSSSSNLNVHVDPLVRDTSLLMRRLSWCSWWAQLSLTIVSSITLLFARNVIKGSTTVSSSAGSLPNFVLAGTGIVLSFGSIFWTWATRRLARRLLKRPTSRIQAANMVRKDITIGVILNLLGMTCTIIGAEQIIGTLAIKVLTNASYRTSPMLDIGGGGSSGFIQPLDILIVQANTNTVLSHFCSLISLLYLTRKVLQLDPPSSTTQEKDKNNNNGKGKGTK